MKSAEEIKIFVEKQLEHAKHGGKITNDSYCNIIYSAYFDQCVAILDFINEPSREPTGSIC